MKTFIGIWTQEINKKQARIWCSVDEEGEISLQDNFHFKKLAYYRRSSLWRGLDDEGNEWQLVQRIDKNGNIHGIGNFQVSHTKQSKRIQIKRHKAKRQRELGFIPLTPPLDIPFDWHHVDKNHVVAVQREIHRSVCHTWHDNNIEGILG